MRTRALPRWCMLVVLTALCMTAPGAGGDIVVAGKYTAVDGAGVFYLDEGPDDARPL